MSNEFGNGVLQLAVAQMPVKSATCMEDVDYNTDVIIEYIERAVTGFAGVDMVVFPECCFQGMSNPNKWVDVAISMDSEPIRRVRETCKDLGVWGLFNPWIKPEDGTFVENKAIIVNDQGEIVLEYVKMNPTIPMEGTKPGRELTVCDGPKGARFAVIICADIGYPELWREATHKGANVILHPSHWPSGVTPFDDLWELANRTCAVFSNAYVVGVNSVGQDEILTFKGNSMVVDPVGKIISEAPVGIPAINYTTIIPSQVDMMRTQGGADGTLASWNWNNRGASCPDQKGVGLGISDYTAYKE